MIREIPDLRQIRAFVALAETGNFTRASEQLFLTQSAVSHSIRSLENLMGVELVERSAKRLSLTQVGVVFLRRCKTILHELNLADKEVEALKRWGQGRIRLGATHTICEYLLPAVLREFRDCFNRCEIHVESADTNALLERLDAAKLDLVIGIGGRSPSWARFIPIFSDELVFVVSAHHPWATREEIGLEEIAQESFLAYSKSSETHRLVRSLFENLGLKLRITLNLGSMASIIEMAKIGVGVGIVSPWIAREDLERGDLVEVPIRAEPVVREWGAFLLDGKKLSIVEDTFLGICELTARNLTFSHQKKASPKQ